MKRRILLLVAALLLALASAAIWQLRFKAVPGALPPTGIDDPPVGWELRPAGHREVLDTPEGPVLRLAQVEPPERNLGMHLWLGALPGVRYIHIHCEARCEDLGPAGVRYMDLRLMVMMKDRDGRPSHPPDCQVLRLAGSSGWTSHDLVFALTREMVDTGFDLTMLAQQGQAEVRDLTLTAVRLRPWVRPATTATVVGWAAWFACALPAGIGLRRRILTAAALTAFGWFVVFPQSKRRLPSLVGDFPVQREAARHLPPAPPAPPPTPPPPPRPAVEAGHPPAAPSPSPAPADPTAGRRTEPGPTFAENADRDSGTLRQEVADLDRGAEFLHLLLFAGFAAGMATLAGRTSVWPLLTGIAVLSELVPNLIDRSPDLHDLLDLVENLAGVGLGIGLVIAARRIRARRRQARPAAPP